jgi:hypothetical protein
MLEKIAKFAAWVTIAFIIYATLVPIGLRPTLGPISPNYERFVAYAIASVAIGLAYPRRPIRVATMVIALVVVLEVAQLAIPGRDARVGDALIKALGALAGIGAAALGNQRMVRHVLPSAKS